MAPRILTPKEVGQISVTRLKVTPIRQTIRRRTSPLFSSAKRSLFPVLSPNSTNQKVAKQFKAAMLGNLQQVKELMKQYGPAVRKPITRFTLLHEAAMANQTTTVSYLLDLISPNVVSNLNQTPAHLAASMGYTQVLKVLTTDEEMKPDIRDSNGKTYNDLLIPHLFEAIFAGEKKRVLNLLSLGANPDGKVGSHGSDVLARELKITTPRQLALVLDRTSFIEMSGKTTKKPISMPKNDSHALMIPEKSYKVDGDKTVGPLRIKAKRRSTPLESENGYCQKNEDKKGYVFIFNYGSFNGRPDLDLEASEDDARNLANVFSQLGYSGEVYHSLAVKETKETLTRLKDMEELNDAAGVTFIISSHGTSNNGAFLTSDMELLPTDWLLKLFSDVECPQLKDKPKLFIFDFCCGYYSDSKPTALKPYPYARVQEPLRDMMCIYSSKGGFTSYNFTKDGSMFPNALCRTLAQHACSKELYDIFIELIIECNKVSPSIAPYLRNIGFTKSFFFC